MSGALTYLDEQIEAIRSRLPAALHEFDKTAIHQARVGTRRLKAAFDVLAPLLTDLNAKGLTKAGKTVRRRLGPLRDLDVIIDAVAAADLAPRSADALAWVGHHFDTERADARTANPLGPKKSAKMMARFDDWWRVRHGLESRVDAFGPLLTDIVHARFNAFADLADRVSGVVETPADAPPIDVHELRIDGKAVRYVFELAAAHGMAIPNRIAKTFKAMQDALGDWHDEVVLADRILRAVIDTQITLHRPALAAAVLDVARMYLQRSERSLARFNARWKHAGASIRQTVVDNVPLTTDARPPLVDDTPSATPLPNLAAPPDEAS